MTAADDTQGLFAPETPEPRQAPAARPLWKVLVVDDEPDVEAVTRQALRWVRFDGGEIVIVSARSGAEARALTEAHPDAAVILLDVVMETPTAGLDFVKWLRETGRLPHARVLLRTGQPGTAPEGSVMTDYDLHDYLEKTEVSVARLRTSVLGGLRAFRDLRSIELHRRGLEQVLLATAGLFRPRSAEALVKGVLTELSSLLVPEADLLFFRTLTEKPGEPPPVLAATGRFAAFEGRPVTDALGDHSWSRLAASLQPGALAPFDGHTVYAFRNTLDGTASVVIGGPRELDRLRRSLVELFGTNASMALDNQSLSRRQARTLEAVRRFVPQPLLDMMGVSNVEEITLGHHVRTQMTVLFCDIVGFTRLSESLNSDQLFALVNRLFAVLTPPVEANGGVVDKYLGDGLMALFPTAEAAVNAAIAMHAGLDAANASGRFDPPLELGVGLHTGPVALGTVGHEQRMDTTVVSEAVNVAARVEELTRTYGSRILASDAVVEALGPDLARQVRFLGVARVRGKARPVRIAEIIAADPPPRRLARERGRDRLAQAVAQAEAGHVLEARRTLRALANDEPDDPTPARLAALLDAPTGEP